ncbi:hypothetical protein PJP07_30645, partial [Mycobacterium kansasii]
MLYFFKEFEIDHNNKERVSNSFEYLKMLGDKVAYANKPNPQLENLYSSFVGHTFVPSVTKLDEDA